MANIVTLKNNTTNEINYPRTVKSALLNDDGTPMQPVTMGELGDIVNTSDIINDLTTGGTFTGVAVAQNNTAYTTKQLRNITLSTANPSGGSNGDIWIKYV